MTTKQWLSRALRIDGDIYALMEIRDKEKQRLTSITAKLTGETIQATKDPHKYDRLVELDGAIDDLIDRQLAIKAEVISAIGQVEKPLYRIILLHRYIDNMTFPAIAKTVNMSREHVCRLHGRALIEIGGIINGQT